MRYEKLDELRGITIISMLLYHMCWDLVYIAGRSMPMFTSMPGHIWQQSICVTFIMLSGFCFSMGSKPMQRGLIVFMAGLLVTAVTLIFIPENRVVFGVLTLIGSAMLITAVMNELLCRLNAVCGFAAAVLLFMIFYRVNRGYISLLGLEAAVPEELYHGLVSTFLGFMEPGFFSADYFSILPWYFIFLAGYYLYAILNKADKLALLKKGHIAPLAFLGRHSLMIYLLHQPVLYGITVYFGVILTSQISYANRG